MPIISNIYSRLTTCTAWAGFQEKELIRSRRKAANRSTIRAVALLAGGSFLFFWIGTWIGLLVEPAYDYWSWYLFLFGLGTLFSTLYLIIRRLVPEHDHGGLYLALSLLVVVGLNLLGMHKVGDRSVYLLALMLCALLYSGPLQWYILVFTGTWCASLAGMVFLFPGPRIINDAVVLGLVTLLSMATGIALEIRRCTTSILSHRLRRSNEELKVLSMQDPLTGVYNRRYLMDWLGRTAGGSRSQDLKLVLAVLDLDHFKDINDRYGHHAGDDALKVCAQVLGRELRQADVVARYGGDEFVVAMPDTTGEQAFQVMDRCRLALADQELHGLPESLTFSCGLAVWWPGMDESALFSAADQWLYRAKIQGRNRVAADTTVIGK